VLTKVVTMVDVSEAVRVESSEEATLELGLATWVAVLAIVVTMVEVSEAVMVEVAEDIALELTGLVALEIVTEEVASQKVREVVRVISSVDETVMMASEVQDGEDATGTTV